MSCWGENGAAFYERNWEKTLKPLIKFQLPWKVPKLMLIFNENFTAKMKHKNVFVLQEKLLFIDFLKQFQSYCSYSISKNTYAETIVTLARDSIWDNNCGTFRIFLKYEKYTYVLT